MNKRYMTHTNSNIDYTILDRPKLFILKTYVLKSLEQKLKTCMLIQFKSNVQHYNTYYYRRLIFYFSSFSFIQVWIRLIAENSCGHNSMLYLHESSYENLGDLFHFKYKKHQRKILFVILSQLFRFPGSKDLDIN